MKNWIFFLLTILWVIMVAGCSFSSVPTVSEFQEPISSDELKNIPDWKSMVPDPYELYDIPGHCFYSSSGVRDDGYQFMLYSAIEDDFVTYVQKSKEMGFTDVVMEEKYMVLLHNSDMKYTLSIYFTEDEDDPNQNWIMVDITYSQD